MLWIILLGLGFIGTYFVVDEWMARRSNVEKSHEQVSKLKIVLSFLLKTISIGALMGLIGYGIGFGLSYFIGSDWSFAGIVSLHVGMGLWAGACGLVVGFSFAFREYIRAIRQNSE